MIKTFDMRERMHLTNSTAALGEVVVNAIDAAMHSATPKVEIRFPSGNACKFTKAGHHYIQILNNGTSFENIENGLSIYMSSHSTVNHVFGLGLKLFLAYYGGREDVNDGTAGINFIIETKLKDKILYMEGPYTENMTKKYRPLSDWQYGNMVTSIMVEVPKNTWDSLNMKELYDFLCWKFGMKVYFNPNLKIKFGESELIQPNLPGVMPENLSVKEANLDEFNRPVTCGSAAFNDDGMSNRFAYNYIHWNKTSKEFANRKNQGITIFCDWVAIAHLGTSIVAKSTMLKRSQVEAWNADEFGYRTHDSRNGLVTYVNITPNSNVLVPFTGDKSAIDLSSENGIICRREIDALVGGFYRYKTRKGDEESLEKLTSKYIKLTLSMVDTPDTPKWEVLRQAKLTADKKGKKVDIAIVRVTPSNEAKISAFKASKRKSYVFSKEDFADPDSALVIAELKKPGLPLEMSTLDQAFRYGFIINNRYGFDDKKITYVFNWNGTYDTEEEWPYLKRKKKVEKYDRIVLLPDIRDYVEI